MNSIKQFLKPTIWKIFLAIIFFGYLFSPLIFPRVPLHPMAEILRCGYGKGSFSVISCSFVGTEILFNIQIVLAFFYHIIFSKILGGHQSIFAGGYKATLFRFIFSFILSYVFSCFFVVSFCKLKTLFVPKNNPKH